MSFNTFGKIFRFTTWGESHGPAIAVLLMVAHQISIYLKKNTGRHEPKKARKYKICVTRRESDKIEILSRCLVGNQRVHLYQY